ncbi:MAG: LolA family protein [Pseudomonadales bacterium]
MAAVRSVLVLVGLGLACACYGADNELGWTLDSALRQIDRQAGDFSTALADVEVLRQTEDGKGNKESSGRVYVNKQGAIRFDVKNPEERTILAVKNKVHVYDPVRALVELYSSKKDKARLEPLVRIGFTSTGKDLKKDYLVTLLGEDKIRGRRVVGLELTPKKESSREHVARVRVWIDQASWMPLEQEISQVEGGASLKISYTDMARNLKLNDELFRPRWPKGTETIKRKPQ